MASERDSEKESESSYNFGYKIDLDENRRTFPKEEGLNFDSFVFSQTRNRQLRKSRDDSVSNSKPGSKTSKIRHQATQSKANLADKELTQTTQQQPQPPPQKKISMGISKAPSEKSTDLIANIPTLTLIPAIQPVFLPPQESEYQSITREIEFYTRQAEILEYDSSKLKDKEVEMMRAQQTLDRRIELASNEVLDMNTKIADLASYEESIERILLLTRGEKENLLREMDVPNERGDPINDEERKLINELDAIEREFKELAQETVPLELSLRPSSDIKPAAVDNSSTQFLFNLHQLGSDYNKHLYNIKMSCLKPRWILFQNADLQIGAVYDFSSNESVSVTLHVGNKSSQAINSIQLKSQKEDLLHVESLSRNNFVEAFKVADSPSFYFTNLTYRAGEKDVIQRLVVPFGWMKFGDFEIVTPQGFLKLWKDRDGEIKSEKYPVDTDMVSELDDFRKHFPNLVEIPHKDGKQWAGLFRVERGEFRGTKLLLKFRLSLETYQVVIARTKNTSDMREKVMQHFCFLLSV